MSALRFSVVVVLLASAVASAQAYQRTLVPGKQLCLTWNKRDFTYNVDAAGSSQTPGEGEFVAIDAAFQSWNALSDSCSDFRFLRGPRLSKVVVGKATGSLDNNVITFRETICRDVVPLEDPCVLEDTCGNTYNCWDHSDSTIGLTTTTFSFKTGTIFDADIELNAAPRTEGEQFLFTTVSSPPCDPSKISAACVATDVQNTMTHEIGHAVGLDHVDVLGATMEPSAPLGRPRSGFSTRGRRRGSATPTPRARRRCPATSWVSCERRSSPRARAPGSRDARRRAVA
jgi:hypothetical protein